MRIFGLAAAAATLAVAGAQPAAAKDSNPAKDLRHALVTMVSQGDNPPGQSTRPDDPDMGDDNAARRAILTVCTMDTPAAERSAICDRSPVSPD